MPSRDPTILYQHMLDHAREAVSLVQGRTRADLDSDRLLNLALWYACWKLSVRRHIVSRLMNKPIILKFHGHKL